MHKWDVLKLLNIHLLVIYYPTRLIYLMILTEILSYALHQLCRKYCNASKPNKDIFSFC